MFAFSIIHFIIFAKYNSQGHFQVHFQAYISINEI